MDMKLAASPYWKVVRVKSVPAFYGRAFNDEEGKE